MGEQTRGNGMAIVALVIVAVTTSEPVFAGIALLGAGVAAAELVSPRAASVIEENRRLVYGGLLAITAAGLWSVFAA